ncbi:predicted protein [Plenodomus lingam JN3]|uniref:Predicted protein n=1 Tax=Leptosphaeria maculans (strain JN3 / isolate v23.1.3 / race Av1-4-5-6-7-8) TaxID=985895 RepID=E4ZP63_LEPMJ|nr:predicted protein [Plenodomus lingam JN3]CBX93088.1 predicted protein [Plenodomus lingam JN3]
MNNPTMAEHQQQNKFFHLSSLCIEYAWHEWILPLCSLKGTIFTSSWIRYRVRPAPSGCSLAVHVSSNPCG